MVAPANINFMVIGEITAGETLGQIHHNSGVSNKTAHRGVYLYHYKIDINEENMI